MNTNPQDPKPQRPPIPEPVDAVAREIVHATFLVHKALGPGLLESVYEVCLAHELTKRSLPLKRQLTLPVNYDGIRIDAGLRLDMLVDDAVIVELKAVDALLPVHRAQALTYLKLTGHRLAFLINFNVPVIRNGIVRIAL